MRFPREIFSRFVDDRAGGEMVEYAVLLGMVTLVGIVTFISMRDQILGVYLYIRDAI